MAGIKQSWAIGGSIFLAAATGLIAVADDTPIRGADAPITDQPVFVPPPAGVYLGPEPSTVIAAPAQPYGPYDNALSQPCQTGYFSRCRQRCRARFWGYPEEFIEPPLGSTVAVMYSVQVANGQAARMVLYQYDFLPASDQLTVRGKDQLAKIAMWLPTNMFPVFVEPTPASPELDELRRQAVWQAFSNELYSIPAERVVIGRPKVRGLDSVDALAIDRNRLGQTLTRGLSAGGGGITGSSSPSDAPTGSTGQ